MLDSLLSPLVPESQYAFVIQKHWEGPGHCGGRSKNCLRWIRKSHMREMKHMEKHLTFHIQTKCILGNPHILILHKGVEVLGVAEAWVPGGDQGQLRKAGELD